MRDEAHRFGITHHRNRRSKGFTITTLTEVDGVGQKTSQMLLSAFKSVKKIKEASEEELSNIIGAKLAKAVYLHFNENN